jgi:hypothetical protein
LTAIFLALICCLPAAAPDSTPRYSGTFTFKDELKITGKRVNQPYEVTEVQELRCTVEADHPSQAKCIGTITGATKETCPNGRDCSASLAGQGESFPSYLHIGVENGKLIINFGSFRIPVKSSSALLGVGQENLDGSLGGWILEEPVSGNTGSLSGTKVIELGKSDQTDRSDGVSRIRTFTWGLMQSSGKGPGDDPGDTEEEEVEVSVKPEAGYEKWEPEANFQQPDQPRKRLSVSVRAHKAGEPGTPHCWSYLNVKDKTLDTPN